MNDVCDRLYGLVLSSTVLEKESEPMYVSIENTAGSIFAMELYVIEERIPNSQSINFALILGAIDIEQMAIIKTYNIQQVVFYLSNFSDIDFKILSGLGEISLHFISCIINLLQKTQLELVTLSLRGCLVNCTLQLDRIKQLVLEDHWAFPITTEGKNFDLFLGGRHLKRIDAKKLVNFIESESVRDLLIDNCSLNSTGLRKLLQANLNEIHFSNSFLTSRSTSRLESSTITVFDVSGLKNIAFDQIADVLENWNQLKTLVLGTVLLTEERIHKLQQYTSCSIDCMLTRLPAGQSHLRGSLTGNLQF